MDLRKLPDGLTPDERCDERRSRIEQELNLDLRLLKADPMTIGDADTKNCEQMFGQIPVPLGLAGPLTIRFSNDESKNIWLPLATTEGALIASVNRGCKATADGIRTQSTYHGMTRSLCFKETSAKETRNKTQETGNKETSLLKTHPSTILRASVSRLKTLHNQWKLIAEQTSSHLRILSYDIDTSDEYLFLTIHCDTDEAMGMNMTTIAAQAIGEWIAENVDGLEFVTVAGNVDSDKKPSRRTHDQGRGYEVTASVVISEKILESVLKTSSDQMMEVAKAKLEHGSTLAGAIGTNLHAANIIAALYLATGQDIAHTVEGSLTDTSVEMLPDGLRISVRLPAVLVGVLGGGTNLPAQKKALELLLQKKSGLKPVKQLAETIGAAVLAGELSLLAAQASHTLSKAHRKHGRSEKL